MVLKDKTIELFRCLEDLYFEREHSETDLSMLGINKEIQNLEYLIQEHCFNNYGMPWFRLWTVWKTRDVVSINEPIDSCNKI